MYTVHFHDIVARYFSMRMVYSVLMVVVLGVVFGTPTQSHAQVTLSGTVFTDAGVTPLAVAETINVAVGTSTPSVFSTTSSVTTGAWTVTIPAGHAIASSTPILVWIDNDVTTRGQVLTKASSSQSVQSITGLDIYRDRAIVRHEATSGTSTGLADFSFYTSAQDSDVLHSTSTGLITFAPGIEVYVWGGDVFAPQSAVTIGGNTNGSSTDGSLYIGNGATYTASGTLTMRGSLQLHANATFTPGTFTTVFTATSTGKVLTVNSASIGNVTFNGVGGEWTFTSAATTSALTILRGTVIAPATTLTVTGVLQNDATFSHNGGTVYVTGPASASLADIVPYVTGLDAAGGTATGTLGSSGVNAMAISGNTLYIAKQSQGTTCSATINTAGANACELSVFDISSTTNPVFITGRDTNGDIGNTGNLAFNYVLATSGRVFIAKVGNGGGCANTGAGAGGCELMIYDISSTTNPIYRSGRDSAGAAGSASESATVLAATTVLGSTTLYMGKAGSATNCVQTVGSSQGCELMVFDVSSTTNPLFRAGQDVSGSTTGTSNLTIRDLKVYGNTLYVAKNGSSTACAQTASSAVGCELMVFNISSTTNPQYIAGRDATGSATGTASSTILAMEVWGDKLYVGQFGSTTPCVQVEGQTIGCEIIVFDISSTTNPTFTQGIDVAGSYTGSSNIGITSLHARNNYLYAATAGSAVPCSQGTGLAIGCELIVFDISSSSAVRMLSSVDIGGNSTGTLALGASFVISTGSTLYVSKSGNATNCSATPGSAIGCEVLAFNVSRTGQGIVSAGLTGASALNHVIASGTVEFRAMASTTNFTVAAGTTTAPGVLTVAGNYTNSSNFVANNGTLVMSSSSAQTMSGSMIGSNSLYQVTFAGGGTKTMQANASTTYFTAHAGAVVALPDQLTVSDSFTNNGTLITATGTIHTKGYLNEFISGVSAGGSSIDAIGLGINALKQVGNTLYVGKANSPTACSQVAGAAVGCELLVFNVASTTNPILVNSFDSSGSSNGVGDVAVTKFAVSSTSQELYVAKAGLATACNPTSGNAAGCEILVFDISSTTNPIFRNGIDSSGDNASTSAIGAVDVLAQGAWLYVAKGGLASTCTQVAGTAAGCELMVFSLASTTNPVYVAGRDSDGNAAGVTATAATSLAFAPEALFLSKAAAGATACTTQANCEIMTFNLSSSSNPLFIRGRDVSGSQSGTGNIGVRHLAVQGSVLYVGKGGSPTLCQGVSGSAVGCELMLYDISSTTNPNFLTGRDMSGELTATGTADVSINYVIASNTQLYIAKGGNATACSQTAGLAVGCELMVFDISSTTNPLYKKGLDSDTKPDGTTATATQAIELTSNTLTVARALDITPCQQEFGLRTGCELLFMNVPTTLGGSLTGTGALASVTTDGLTRFTASASTTHLIVATSSTLVAPSSTLSISGDLTLLGGFQHNNGHVSLHGTNQQVTASATTTFYDLSNTPSSAATTTFSTPSPFVILRNLTLRGASANQPLRVRSASTTAQWKLDPQSTTTISFAFLEVQDSNNISTATTTLACPATCFDRGNNTNWSFSPEITWNPTDWSLYEAITINEANIDEDLTDFPVFVDLSNLSSDFWNTVSSDGGDIRVTTVDNVEVPREVVFVTTSNDSGELHFKAPTLSSTTDTVFKIWYNGTTTGGYASTSLYGSRNVWSNDFLAVYHLNEDPSTAGTNGILDSTASGLHGTASGTMSSSDTVTGKAGNAIDFDGINDFINMTIETEFNTGDGAVTAWYRPDSLLTNDKTIWGYTDGAIANGNIYAQVRNHGDATNGRKPSIFSYDTATRMVATSLVATSTWYHSAVTFNNTDLQEIYHNGTLENSRASNDSMTNPAAAFGIGARATNNTTDSFFQGPIDEVRISSTTRSAAWIKAEYYNQGTTTDFYGVAGSVITGSSTLANHTAGQVVNAFNFANKTNAELFAFRLTPNSGNATVTNMVVTLSGVTNVNGGDFSNIKLLRDIDNDAQYDATDVEVGGAGAMSIPGTDGTITFTGDFAATTSQNYLLTADWTAPSNGSFMRVSLSPSLITMVDSNPAYEVLGSVTAVQHNRNNKGGGGGSASVGDPAPAGDGDRGGGGSNGGELIGSNPDFFWPSAQSGSWNSPSNAYDQTDGTYATTSSANNQSYTNHGFSVPSSNTISGIEVKLELSGTTAAGLVGVELSWNGGANYTSVKNTPTLGTSDAVYTIGSPSDLWGRTWAASEFTNGNFVVRLSGSPSSNTIRLDAIQVRVYHVASGGGSGGGGGSGAGGGIE